MRGWPCEAMLSCGLLGRVGGDRAAAKAVRVSLRDLDLHVVADQPGRSGEIDDAVVLGARGEVVLALPRNAFHEHALTGAHHGARVLLGELLDAGLEAL